MDAQSPDGRPYPTQTPQMVIPTPDDFSEAHDVPDEYDTLDGGPTLIADSPSAHKATLERRLEVPGSGHTSSTDGAQKSPPLHGLKVILD